MVSCGFDPLLSYQFFKEKFMKISAKQNEYLLEFEKFKDVEILPGRQYILNDRITVSVVSYDSETNSCEIQSKSGIITKKTAHWARKNLKLVSQ